MSDQDPSTSSSSYKNIIVTGDSRNVFGNVGSFDAGQQQKPQKVACWSSNFKRQLHTIQAKQASSQDVTHLALRLTPHLLKDFRDLRVRLPESGRYTKKASDVSNELRAREAILKRAICQLILSSGAFDNKTADSMVQDQSHQGWSDTQFELHLDTLFGTKVSGPDTMLESIAAEIESIGSVLKEANTIRESLLAQASLANSFNDEIPYLYHVLTGVQQSRSDEIKSCLEDRLNNTSFRDSLTTLRTIVEDFRSLVPRLRSSNNEHDSVSPSSTFKEQMPSIRAIRDAAGELYRAFGYVCTQHEKHSVCLNTKADWKYPNRTTFNVLFEGEHNDPKPHLRSRPVDLNFRQTPTIFPPWQPQPLIIESEQKRPATHESNVSLPTAKNNCHAVRKRSLSLDGSVVWPKRKTANSKSMVVTDPQSSPGAFESPPTGTALAQPLERVSQFPNFFITKNFCSSIDQALSESALLDQINSLGYYDDGRASLRCIIYLSRAAASSLYPCKGGACSHSPFSNSTPVCPSRLTKLEVIRVARHLAIGLLRFHSTPWIRIPWTRDQVVLLRSEENGLSEPYLQAKIGTTHEGRAAPDAVDRAIIRNQTIFGFGTILLELAFAQTLEQMRRPVDIDQQYQPNTAYYTAQRILRNVSGKMGRTFSNLVERCIKCDFGNGQDLMNESLQEAFHQQVVIQLDELEESFRKIDW